MNIRRRLADVQALVSEHMSDYMIEPQGPARRLLEAMEYSVQGGKRVRAFITIQAAETFGTDRTDVLPAAIAVEFMHAASLVHDDMPCIDDSPMRRGRPSCHAEADEHTALLAGDALIIRAFELLASVRAGIGAAPAARVVEEFARATGAEGLIAGEAADIEAERMEPDEQTLEYIHINKTARLIVAAARTGAILAGAPDDDIDRISEYARHLGLLFQITDDLLDETATQTQLGKPVGADEASGKMTYPALLGIEQTRVRAGQTAELALEAAEALPNRRKTWRGLVELVLNREK
jgi:geranylgeranyl diphosphate synthase type II